jgi:hypothetical protein
MAGGTDVVEVRIISAVLVKRINPCGLGKDDSVIVDFGTDSVQIG